MDLPALLPGVSAILCAVLAFIALYRSVAAAPTRAGAYVVITGRGYEAGQLDEYKRVVPALIKAFGGEYVAVSVDVDVLEGRGDVKAVVVSKWASVSAARRFWDSPEYAEARKLRDGVGEFDIVLLPALGGAVMR